MIKLAPIMTETYAWQRVAGQPLPTLNDVQKQHRSKRSDKSISAMDRDIAEGLVYYGYVDTEDVALRIVANSLVESKAVKAIYSNSQLTDKARIRAIAGYLDFNAVHEAYDADGVDEAADSKTHVVYACNVELEDGTIKPDVRISVEKGDDAESKVRAKLEDRFKGCKIRKMTKAQNPGKNDNDSPRWQDTDGDGKWYEAGDDVSEGEDIPDLGRLNMGGTLDESKFWGRIKGNFNGHEYILREEFRK